MRQSRSLEERLEIILEHYVDLGDGCWNWRGPVNSNGYGIAMTIIDGGKQQHRVHRLSYLIYNGDIPEGLIICHRCDNRLCMNPAHLYAGTVLDNARDREASRLRRLAQQAGA